MHIDNIINIPNEKCKSFFHLHNTKKKILWPVGIYFTRNFE